MRYKLLTVVYTAGGNQAAVYHYTATSIFEISLFINLGVLGLTKFYTYTAGGNQAAATYTLIGVAFIQFLGLVSYQIYYLLKPLFSHIVMTMKQLRIFGGMTPPWS